jgi:hypothetical protein
LDWQELFLKIRELQLTELEIFPIPAELGFNQDAIGIAVSQRYETKEKVLVQLEKINNLLEPMDIELRELYNGELMEETSMKRIVMALLQG